MIHPTTNAIVMEVNRLTTKNNINKSYKRINQCVFQSILRYFLYKYLL